MAERVLESKEKYSNTKELLDNCKESVVGISFMPQVFFYIEHGVQPEYVFPKERDNRGRATFWFSKEKTRHLKKMWDDTKENR